MNFDTVNDVSYVVGQPAKTIYNFFHRLIRPRGSSMSRCSRTSAASNWALRRTRYQKGGVRPPAWLPGVAGGRNPGC